MNKKNTIIILCLAVLILIAIIFSQLKSGTDIDKLESQSSSSDIQDIEKDLENTDLSNIDAELSDIEKKLE